MVRLAVSSDIDQILRIDSSAQVDESRQTAVRGAVDRGECVVAVNNGILVGYAVMNHAFFDRGFVSLIYIDSAHGSRKVGSILFDEVETRCMSTRFFTSANLSNLPM